MAEDRTWTVWISDQDVYMKPLPGWEQVEVVRASRFEEVQAERDRAIAHDRQPYPTAAAYEAVCEARTKWQERAERAEADLERAQESAERLRSALQTILNLDDAVGINERTTKIAREALARADNREPR